MLISNFIDHILSPVHASAIIAIVSVTTTATITVTVVRDTKQHRCHYPSVIVRLGLCTRHTVMSQLRQPEELEYSFSASSAADWCEGLAYPTA